MKKTIRTLCAVIACFTVLSSQASVNAGAHYYDPYDPYYFVDYKGSISVSESSLKLKEGKSKTVTVTMSNTSGVHISKSGSGVVKTSCSKAKNGTFTMTITAKKAGTEKILIKSKDDSSVYKYITVTVEGSKPASSKKYSDSFQWYSSYTKRYYKSYNDALKASGGKEKYVYRSAKQSASNKPANDPPVSNKPVSNTQQLSYSNSYSKSYPWFSTRTGKYYATYDAALIASGNNADFVLQGDQSAPESRASYEADFTWFSSYTNRYYRTSVDAKRASLGDSKYVSRATEPVAECSDTYTSLYCWWSKTTNKYYMTSKDALRASGGNENDVVLMCP